MVHARYSTANPLLGPTMTLTAKHRILRDEIDEIASLIGLHYGEIDDCSRQLLATFYDILSSTLTFVPAPPPRIEPSVTSSVAPGVRAAIRSLWNSGGITTCG